MSLVRVLRRVAVSALFAALCACQGDDNTLPLPPDAGASDARASDASVDAHVTEASADSHVSDASADSSAPEDDAVAPVANGPDANDAADATGPDANDD
jgi:hypothetical protein